MECEELLHGDITSVSHVLSLSVIRLTAIDVCLSVVDGSLSLVIQVGHLRRGRDLVRNVVEYVLDRVLLG